MTDETFNGWANRETWLVNLWLSNDRGTDECAREIAKAQAGDLAGGEAIKFWLAGDDSPWPAPTEGLLADLIGGCFARVDWRAIGAAFREE